MRELFENEWLPNALMIGISYDDFWHMNPHIIKLHIEGYNLKMKQELQTQNALSHLQGQYFVEALMCTVGNMFGGKHSKKYEYPKEPYGLDKKENGLSEEQKKKQVDALFMSLQIMQTNFELKQLSEKTDGTV